MHATNLLRQEFTTALVLAGRQWRRTVSEAVSELGISEACVSPMLWAGRLGGGVRQVVLAEYVGIEGSSLVRLIDQLEASGLMIRRDDPNDRRAKTIWLTPEGERISARIEERLVDLRTEVLGGVAPEQLTVMLQLLRAFGAPEPHRRAELVS